MATELTKQEAKIKEMLEQVSENTLWGVAINRVLKDFTTDRFRDLLAQLSSQAKDQPETMEDIVGREAMIELLGYIQPV